MKVMELTQQPQHQDRLRQWESYSRKMTIVMALIVLLSISSSISLVVHGYSALPSSAKTATASSSASSSFLSSSSPSLLSFGFYKPISSQQQHHHQQIQLHRLFATTNVVIEESSSSSSSQSKISKNKQKEQQKQDKEEVDDGNHQVWTLASCTTTAALPPWLPQLQQQQQGNSQFANTNQLQQYVDDQLQYFELSLVEHFTSSKAVQEIMNAIHLTTQGDSSILLGLLEFCKLILHQRQQTMVGTTNNDAFVTKDVLLASIYHYVDCITQKSTMTTTKSPQQDLSSTVLQLEQEQPTSMQSQTFTKATDKVTCTSPVDVCWELSKKSKCKNNNIKNKTNKNKRTNKSSIIIPGQQDYLASLSSPPSSSSSSSSSLSVIGDTFTPYFSQEAIRIAQSAAQIKRAEMMANALYGDKNRALSTGEASKRSDLYLAVMTNDWQALAIRCVACLYQLQTILQHSQNFFIDDSDSNQNSDWNMPFYYNRSPIAIQAAREAIRVYANLAQRLGMNKLKSQLEQYAFYILYPRQYRAVSILFQNNGPAMKSMSRYLSQQITMLLHQDSELMEQVEYLEITERVKEPFSFWKKLLKKRTSSKANSPSTSSSSFLSSSQNISVMDVPDSVALRVIVKAKKPINEPNEDSATTKHREEMLCYYIQHLIQSRWPQIEDQSRNKDYIANPKPNGYQSLHFTSYITVPYSAAANSNKKYDDSVNNNNAVIPTKSTTRLLFEVQIRSEEMHRIAEYGVAAHWDYKLDKTKDNNNKTPLLRSTGKSLPPSTSSSTAPLTTPTRSRQDSTPPSTLIANPAKKVILKRSSTNKKTSSASYIASLVKSSQELTKQKVQIFLLGSTNTTMAGDIVSLPVGSTISNVLSKQDYDCNDAQSTQMPQILKNGRPAKLHEQLKNGDIIMIQSL